jgi:hypothetical protein
MKTNRSVTRNRTRGVSLVEFTAALVLGLPLLITILYATLEASYLFSIRTNTDIAARQAARAMAIEFGKQPNFKTNTAAQQAVYTGIRIPNFVHNNAQFSDPVFSTTSPATVTVTCSYPPGGAYGLPPFPNPDVFKLGGTFTINSTATFGLE